MGIFYSTNLTFYIILQTVFLFENYCLVITILSITINKAVDTPNALICVFEIKSVVVLYE